MGHVLFMKSIDTKRVDLSCPSKDRSTKHFSSTCSSDLVSLSMKNGTSKGKGFRAEVK